MLSDRLHFLAWPAAAALGVAAEWVAFDWTQPDRWLPDLAVGWTFIACGLIATTRRADSRSGVLMTLTGLGWFVPNFAAVDLDFVSSLVTSAFYLHRGPLVHLIVTYPSGSSSSQLERVTVWLGYAAALVAPIWSSDPLAVVLSVLLIAVTTHGYLRSLGRRRRARLLSLCAASALGLVLIGGVAARLSLPDGEVAAAALLAYEVTLITIASGLFVGLTSDAWGRTDVADLVVELGADRSGTLRGALSRALGDPTLEIGYWVEGAASFVDSDGRTMSLPGPGSDRAVTLIERDGRPVAAILHDAVVLDDPKLVEAVTSAAQLAAVNVRLQAEVRARVDEVAASRRRILAARDDERSQVERRLREGPQSRLERLAQDLRRGRQTASGTSAKEQILRAEDRLARTIDELQRLGQGLHPRLLSEEGLERALGSWAETFPIPVELDLSMHRMEPSAEAAVYFVCAEAMANVSKHSSASRVWVRVEVHGRRVVVVIEDDGVGGANPAAGSGLRGLADRISTLGGTLHIESEEGRGTRLTAEIPLGGEDF